MNHENKNKILILLAFISLTLSYSINTWFSISGIYIFILSVIIMSIVFKNKNNENILVNFEVGIVLKVLLFFFALLFFTLDVVDINGELSLAMILGRFSVFLCYLFILMYFFNKPKLSFLKFFHANKFLIILILFAAILFSTIKITKIPSIDVYNVLRNGPLQLLSLKNPYVFTNIDSKYAAPGLSYNYFAYGPTALFLFLPVDLLLKDPRYLIAAAILGTAICLYKIAKNSGNKEEVSQLVALIYLFTPRHISFMTFSLTDDLILFFIAFGILMYQVKKEYVFAIVLSLLVGLKALYAAPLIFLIKNKKLRTWKFLTIGSIFTFLIYLPFIILNAQALYVSSFLSNINQISNYDLRKQGLTLATLLDRQFHYFPPAIFFPFVETILVIFFWFLLPSTNSMPKALLAVSLVFSVLIFFGPIGNANYYFTASSVLLISFSLIKEYEK